MKKIQFSFQINNDRDYGTPGESYVITDIVDKKVTDLVIPEFYEGKPVVRFRIYEDNIYPHIKTITSPHSDLNLNFSPASFPNLESIKVEKFIGPSNGHFTEDGILYYGIPGNRMVGLIAYPAAKKDKKIVLADHTYLTEDCFRGAKFLEAIILPRCLHTIPSGAFYDVKKLKEIDVPKDVSEIGGYAFAHCHALKRVTFHAEESYMGLTVMGDGVFYDCKNLKKITIPYTVKMFGKNMFSGCSSLTRVDGKFSGYQTIGGVLHALTIFRDLLHLYYYPSARKSKNDTYQVKGSIEYIHAGAFYEVRYLKKVILPKGIREIERGAFSSSSSIKEVIYLGSEEEWNAIKKDSFPENIKVTF